MNGLLAWRHRFGIQACIAAAVLAVSPELFNRIECGEVDPEPMLAMRIHVLTGGDVPVSSWGSVYLQLVGQFELHPIGTRLPSGWGVALFLGSEIIARLSAEDAIELGEGLIAQANLVADPAEPLPLFPMPTPA